MTYTDIMNKYTKKEQGKIEMFIFLMGMAGAGEPPKNEKEFAELCERIIKK